jgi:hypothetical protein
VSGASNYPADLDTDVNLGRVNEVDYLTPALWNAHTDALESIQGALGVAPQGSSATVAARLDALAAGGLEVVSWWLAANAAHAAGDTDVLHTLNLSAGTWVGYMACVAGLAGGGAGDAPHLWVRDTAGNALGETMGSGEAGEYLPLGGPVLAVLGAASDVTLNYYGGVAATLYSEWVLAGKHRMTGFVLVKVA